MLVAFGSDHGGADLKRGLLARAGSLAPDIEAIDLGDDGSDPLDDYPDFSLRLGRAVADGRAQRGILICGSGVGAAIAANKDPRRPRLRLPRPLQRAPGRRT